MTSPTTKELLMRVIAVESPKLFDGSDNEPIEVTSYSYQEEGTRLCDTCDYPELLFIGYRTRGGETGDHVAHRFHMRTVSLQIKGLSAGPLTNGGIHCLRLSE